MSEQPLLTIRIVYDDTPTLVEIETKVRRGNWSGQATAYTSPYELETQALALEAWSNNRLDETTIEAGADDGIGWLMLRFYVTDKAGHSECQVTLATKDYEQDKIDRLNLSFHSDPVQIERFAKQLASLAKTLKGEARLEGRVN